jgi:hypothetical protein
MSNVTFKGLASIEGIPGTFDVIVWLPQTGRFGDNFQEEVIMDQHGGDTAWLARNQHLLADVGMKVVGGSSSAALTAQTWPLAPYTTVTLSGFVFSALNGQYQYLTGADLNLTFDKVAEATFKLRKYINSAQNTLANTTPS